MNIIKFYCTIPRDTEKVELITQILNDQGYIVFIEPQNDKYAVFTMRMEDWNENKRFQ